MKNLSLILLALVMVALLTACFNIDDNYSDYSKVNDYDNDDINYAIDGPWLWTAMANEHDPILIGEWKLYGWSTRDGFAPALERDEDLIFNFNDDGSGWRTNSNGTENFCWATTNRRVGRVALRDEHGEPLIRRGYPLGYEFYMYDDYSLSLFDWIMGSGDSSLFRKVY